MMEGARETAKQSLRRSGSLPLLVGGVLLLVSLFVPWVVSGQDRNGFEYLPPVALLWAVVALWAIGLSLTLARTEEPPGLGALTILASVAFLGDLLIVIDAANSTVIAALGGGPSLALVGLLGILVGIWQVEPSSGERSAGS